MWHVWYCVVWWRMALYGVLGYMHMCCSVYVCVVRCRLCGCVLHCYVLLLVYIVLYCITCSGVVVCSSILCYVCVHTIALYDICVVL